MNDCRCYCSYYKLLTIIMRPVILAMAPKLVGQHPSYTSYMQDALRGTGEDGWSDGWMVSLCSNEALQCSSGSPSVLRSLWIPLQNRLNKKVKCICCFLLGSCMQKPFHDSIIADGAGRLLCTVEFFQEWDHILLTGSVLGKTFDIGGA